MVGVGGEPGTVGGAALPRKRVEGRGPGGYGGNPLPANRAALAIVPVTTQPVTTGFPCRSCSRGSPAPATLWSPSCGFSPPPASQTQYASKPSTPPLYPLVNSPPHLVFSPSTQFS